MLAAPDLFTDDPPYIYFAFGFTALMLGQYFCRPSWRRADHRKLRLRSPVGRAWFAGMLVALHVAFAWHLTVLAWPELQRPLVVLWGAVSIPITFVAEALSDAAANRQHGPSRYWTRSRTVASVLRVVMFLVILGSIAWASRIAAP